MTNKKSFRGASKYYSRRVYYNILNQTHVGAEEARKLYRDKKGKYSLPDEIIAFDSKFEFKMYQLLINTWGTKHVAYQYEVELLPPTLCHPLGKDWRVDFVISQPQQGVIAFIETKGFINDWFLTTLATLEVTNPEVFHRLYLVFDTKVPTKHHVIKNLLKVKQVNQGILPRQRIMTFKGFVELNKTMAQAYQQKKIS